MTATVDKLADDAFASKPGVQPWGRAFTNDDLRTLARAAAKTALEELARKKRQDWAPQHCPWVGALDDEAVTYTTEEPS